MDRVRYIYRRDAEPPCYDHNKNTSPGFLCWEMKRRLLAGGASSIFCRQMELFFYYSCPVSHLQWVMQDLEWHHPRIYRRSSIQNENLYPQSVRDIYIYQLYKQRPSAEWFSIHRSGRRDGTTAYNLHWPAV